LHKRAGDPRSHLQTEYFVPEGERLNAHLKLKNVVIIVSEKYQKQILPEYFSVPHPYKKSTF